VLTNFDIFAQAGGAFVAVDKTFPVSVSNGQIQIQFTNGAVNYPTINGIDIEVAPYTSTVSYHINAGGPAVTDSSGISWSADNYFSGGSTYSNDPYMATAGNQSLYSTSRYGTFTYAFPVPNGSYNVTLKFAELYMTGPGQRQFNVSINGSQVLANFDIYAQAGGAFVPLDKTFPVSVSNGQIQIQFTNGAINYPTVNGIDIETAH
jgi:hypothetical protein